ncbi:sialidase-1-like isoform X4 [Cuculus canorus]|uniref:sialidase-1-like isoform X4 n=1 Tax=Cuculus canorus TaxID=55661 RepID=UPI0023AB1016|nr:sialidase-1-like isoform X4 [Cuculus canorus]
MRRKCGRSASRTATSLGGSGAADGARRRQLVVGAAGGREGRPRRAARPPGAVGADPPHSAPGAAAGAGFGGVAAPPGTEPGAALPSARPSGGAAPAQVRPRVVREQLLWVSGEGHGGVHTFRVPLVIVTPGGALLACAEGRKRSPDDVGAKVIACRRSPDRGATWGPTRVATDDGWSPDGLSLGALGVAGGDVLLLFARCAHPPQACGPPTTQLLRSRDDGRSWGAPQNLSGVLGSEVFAPGPGYGIQKRLPPARGRLLFCGHGTLERDGVRLLLSDDGGHSWRWGGTLPAIPFGAPRRPHDFTPDECQPYELPDGSVAVSIRNQNFYRCRCRMVARSWDGGASLPPSAVAFDPVLVDPAVAAGVLVTRGLVFFSNPAHESQGEPDAALELHERHHVVGAGPARVGGAERVLLDGSPAPLRPGLLPAPLPHLRERAEPIHRERCLGDHQHRRAVTPPINPIRHSRLRVMPEGAGSVAIATQRGGSLRTPAGLPCAVPAWSAMVAWR